MWREDQLMNEGPGAFSALARRGFLKAGVAFALMPFIRLAASPEATVQLHDDDGTGRPDDPDQPASPEWINDLIIYEVATKGFTSPNGPESGTFNSLLAKLAYLQELGITGIWLTGYSLCDPHHFYNIWTQYAVIDPGRFDPSLGTDEEFQGAYRGSTSTWHQDISRCNHARANEK